MAKRKRDSAVESLERPSAKRQRSDDEDEDSEHASARKIDLLKLRDDPEIQKLLEHPGTIALERRFHHNFLDTLDRFLLRKKAHHTVCIGSNGNEQIFSAVDFYIFLYSHIINHAAAIATCEAEGYTMRDGYESKTDEAFFVIMWKLKEHGTGGLYHISDLDNELFEPMLEMKDSKVVSAFRVLREEPMKFGVQAKQGKGGLGPFEHAVFWCTPSKSVPGGWDTQWEVMSRSYAVCFAGDERYEY